MQLGPAHAGQAVVDGAAHELVTEPIRELAVGQLHDDAAACRLVNGCDQLALFQARAPSDDCELELSARHRRQLEQLGGRRRQPRKPGADDLADAVGSFELGEQGAGEPELALAVRDQVRLGQGAPQLAHQERVTACEIGDRPGDLRQFCAGAALGDAPYELAHLQVGETLQTHAHDIVRAPEIRERLRERLRNLVLCVAEGGEQQHAPSPSGLCELTQQQQRGRVRPVPVLDHEHYRTPLADPLEKIRHGRVQPVAFGVRVGAHRRRQSGELLTEVGQQANQLAPGRAERGSQLVLVEHRRQALERLRERPVRRVHDCVAGSVQHERTGLRRLGGELADEAALARTRLAPQQHHPAALALGRRQQHAQLLQLGGPANERKRRGNSKWSRKLGH